MQSPYDVAHIPKKKEDTGLFVFAQGSNFYSFSSSSNHGDTTHTGS